MTELLAIEYDGAPVRFTKDGWINGTQVAARFGKRLRNWLRLAETQAYMRALATALNASDVSYLTRRQRGRNGYVLLHPKLGVALARWCSVDFAVWCDLLIDRILRGEATARIKSPNAIGTTSDRESIYSVAGTMVGRMRVSHPTAYRALNDYAGVSRLRDMTCGQIIESAEFGRRVVDGSASLDDVNRMDSHARALRGAPTQRTLFGDESGGEA